MMQAPQSKSDLRNAITKARDQNIQALEYCGRDQKQVTAACKEIQEFVARDTALIIIVKKR
jgi:hypothetical protein